MTFRHTYLYPLSPKRILRAVLFGGGMYLLAYGVTYAILEHMQDEHQKIDAIKERWVYQDVAPSELVIDPESKWVGSIARVPDSDEPLYQFFLWSETILYDQDHVLLRPSIKIVIHKEERLVVIDWDTPVEAGSIQIVFEGSEHATSTNKQWKVSEDGEATQAKDSVALLKAIENSDIIQVASRAHTEGTPLEAFFDTRGLSDFMKELMGDL